MKKTMMSLVAAAIMLLGTTLATAGTITGANHTFVNGDIGTTIFRSNSGADMFDSFPVSALTDGEVTVYNDDVTGNWTVTTGTPTTIDGLPTNYVQLGPRQSATFRTDGGAIRTLIKPVFAPGHDMIWYIRNYTADYRTGSLVNLPVALDTNHCQTIQAACPTIQAAYDKIRMTYPNFMRQTMRMMWDHSSLVTMDYPGALIAWQIPGLPSDYGLTLDGENDGLVRTRVGAGLDGAIHVAGNAQMYVRWTGVRSLGSRPCVQSPYGGFVWLDTVVFYSCTNDTGTVAQAILNAGPRAGQIAVIGPIHVIDDHTSTLFATCLANAYDGGSVYIELGVPVYLWGGANVRFSVATVCASSFGIATTNSADWKDGYGGSPPVTTWNPGTGLIQ
jgi:hypothetical protein